MLEKLATGPLCANRHHLLFPKTTIKHLSDALLPGVMEGEVLQTSSSANPASIQNILITFAKTGWHKQVNEKIVGPFASGPNLFQGAN